MDAHQRAAEVLSRTADEIQQLLLDDAEFVATVAAIEIGRLVRAGELLPRSAMQVGGAYELVPIGRLGELEEAARAVVNQVDVHGAPDPVLVAARELEGVLDGLEMPGHDPDPEPPKRVSKRKPQPKLPPPPVVDELNDECEQPDEEQQEQQVDVVACQRCGVTSDDADFAPERGPVDQMLRSRTRWRVVLCETCMPEGPRKEAVAS